MSAKKTTCAMFIAAAMLVLLIVGAGFAGERDAKQPSKTPKDSTSQTTPVKPQVSAVSASPVDPATGEGINWQVISSGGTEGTSTNYTLKGTLGQTAVGYGSSTNYGLSHGFWQEFGGGCCNHDGMRGDVNYNMVLNVQDLTYLVNYLFKSGPPPPCEKEGDVNGDGNTNVQDLTYLVNYLFKSGPPPAPCP